MSDDNKKLDKDVVDLAATQVGEDATKYGEFVSSYFSWITLDEQKKRAKELNTMTKKGKKEE